MYCIPMSFLIGIMASIYPFVGSGPVFPYLTESFYIDNCNKYWYSSLLFINDFYPWKVEDECGPNLFYVSIEFQLVALFIPCSLIAYRYLSRKKLYAYFIFIIFGFGIVPTVVITIL